jgi:hypothetical protein
MLCLASIGAASANGDNLVFVAAGASRALPDVPTGSLRRVLATAPETAEAAGSVGTTLAASLAATVGLAFAAKVAGNRRLKKVQRRITIGMREYADKTGKFEDADKPPVRKHYTPGQHGYSTLTPGYKPAPAPARQALSRVVEAKMKMRPSDFYKAPFASLKMSDVKQAGSYMVSAETHAMSSPAALPTYVKPSVGVRLEKEKGTKRTPLDNEAYKQYADNRCSLVAGAQKAGCSMSKDFIADRSALTVLLSYLNETLSGELMRQGQEENPLDFVKISKSGSAIVLERLFEKKNMWAEFRPYRGGWKRSEVSNHGDFMPAWIRVATGDLKHKTMMVTGIRQIAGTSAGKQDQSFRFVEYELGGMTFLTRVPTHATADGKNVELAHKNWYYRDKVTCMDTYMKLVLGGVDMMSMALQRSGKLVHAVEMSADSLAAQQPGCVEAAERRMGRLAGLLGKVKDAVNSAGGEGPWVLQWQRGELVLGDYK